MVKTTINSMFAEALITKLNKKILIITPLFGLGNRLRALASAYSIAKCQNLKLIINWVPDCHCDCHFKDLFTNDELNNNIIDHPIDLTPYSDIKFFNYYELDEGGSHNQFIDFDKFNRVYLRSYCIIKSKYSHKFFLHFFESINFNPKINDLISSIDTSNMIGMHIRMEGGSNYQDQEYDKKDLWTKKQQEQMDKWREVSNLDNFMGQINSILTRNPKQIFYIATDLKVNYEKLVNIYGPDTIKFLKRDLYNRSKDQQYYALADIILLSKCTLFYGSFWSSYSELVTYFQTGKIRKNNILSNQFKLNLGKISVCYACKNKHINLVKSLSSIINNDMIDDIVIVDFNTDKVDLKKYLIKNCSALNRDKMLKKINFIKIKNNLPCLLSYAYNISLYFSKNDRIIKSDCNYIYTDQLISNLNKLNLNNKYYSFTWKDTKTINQIHLNELFYLSKTQLNKTNYFNHSIMFQGYEHDDLKNTLNTIYTYKNIVIRDKSVFHAERNDPDPTESLPKNDITDWFGFEIGDNIDHLYLMEYNKMLVKKYPNKTTTRDITNLLKPISINHRYSEYNVDLNKIQKYDTSCNPLNKKKSICRSDIFEAMIQNNFFYRCTSTSIDFNMIITKYEITDIKHKILLFYFFNFKSSGSMTNNKNNLIITLYNCPNLDRCFELLLCLYKNIQNIYVNKIHILLEKSQEKIYIIEDLLNLFQKNVDYYNKIVLSKINKKFTYQDYINYANKNIQGKVIIANNDIIYDETIKIIDYLDKGECICLTSYDTNENEPKLKSISTNKINIFSQDTYVFNSPLEYPLDNKMIPRTNFDNNIINSILSKSKYKCYNLCHDIKSYHIKKYENKSKLVDVKISDNSKNFIQLGLMCNCINDIKKKKKYNKFKSLDDYNMLNN